MAQDQRPVLFCTVVEKDSLARGESQGEGEPYYPTESLAYDPGAREFHAARFLDRTYA